MFSQLSVSHSVQKGWVFGIMSFLGMGISGTRSLLKVGIFRGEGLGMSRWWICPEGWVCPGIPTYLPTGQGT